MRTAKAALRASIAHLFLSLALAAALTVAALATGGGIGSEIVLGVGVMLSVLPWSGLSVLAGFPGRPVSHGLGLPISADETHVVRLASIFASALILACVPVLGLHGPLWVRAVLVGAAVVVAGAATARLLYAFGTMGHRQAALRSAILEFSPEIVVYTGRSEGGAYQILQWLPLLQTVTAKVVVVVRDSSAVRKLQAALPAGVPIICCRENKDLDQVMVPSVHTAFYVNSVTSNANLVSYRSVRHVYLGHGDSDKEISAHPVHRMYDAIFVAGQAAIDRYEANKIWLDDGQAYVIGRPQLEGVVPATGNLSPPGTVLYAPTWSGYNEASSLSSLAYARPFIADLLSRGIRVTFRPHPFSRTSRRDAGYVSAIDDMLSSDGGQHLQSQATSGLSLVDLFNQSDAMVADVSSLLVDYLATRKPIATLASAPAGRGTADQSEQAPSWTKYPSTRHTYVVDSTASGVWKQFLSEDPMRERRIEAADYYLSGTSSKAFRHAVFSLPSPAEPRT